MYIDPVTHARPGCPRRCRLSEPMSETQVQLAEASYHRCAESAAFYTTFYHHLLASNPRLPPLLTSTELKRQHRLLKHALGLLISCARRANPSLLDPDYTPAIGEARRVVLQPGLDYMRSRNQRRTA